jgi:hypothetical protein
MHGLVVRGQAALLAEPLVAFGALKVLARVEVGVEPSQTHITPVPCVASCSCSPRSSPCDDDIATETKVNLFASLFVSVALSCSS